jgi:putative nucleotidyltransferase with HDIG domain
MNAVAPGSFEARDRLRNIVNRTSELTPLASVAVRAIQLAEDDRSAVLDLANVISADQALAARLLRLANSAYYGYARRIGNVREAVILLGTRTVRSVVIATSIIDSLRVPDVAPFKQELFWAHSVSVGLAAEAIVRVTKVASPEDAFTAGVLHDMGKLAIMLSEPQLFRSVVERVLAGAEHREAEVDLLGVSHNEVGGRLARRWNFPDALVEAITHHHAETPGNSIASLADAVAAANAVCNDAGLACGFDWGEIDTSDRASRVAEDARAAIDHVHGGMRGLEAKAHSFLAHAMGDPVRGYSRHDSPPMAVEEEGHRQVA